MTPMVAIAQQMQQAGNMFTATTVNILTEMEKMSPMNAIGKGAGTFTETWSTQKLDDANIFGGPGK